jgi:Ca2+-binding RTX toxin-like protein
MSHRHATRSRRFHLEPLEDRRLLAPVNVLVSEPYQSDLYPTATLAGDKLLIAYTSGEKHTGYSTASTSGALLDVGGGMSGEQPSAAYDPIHGHTYIVNANPRYSGVSELSIYQAGGSQRILLSSNPGDLATPMIAVDGFAGGGNAYLLVKHADGMYFLHAADASSTWSSPLEIGNDFSAQGGYLAIGPDHSVNAFWQFRDVHGNHIVMRRSTNGGATFGSLVTIGGVNAHNVEAVVNPVSGRLYVTYNDDLGQGKGRDVMFSVSADHGATWSAPIVVNDDHSATDQFSPTIAVTPDGANVFLGFRDGRMHPGTNLTDSFGVVGLDQGNSVAFGENFRISSASTPPDVIYANVVPTGRVDQAVASSTSFYYVWSDSRNPNAAGTEAHQNDVFLARIGVTGPGGPYVFAQTPEVQQVDKSVGSVNITFSQAMDKASFSVANDVTAFYGNGQALKPTITGFSWLDDRTLQIRFQPPAATADYKLVLGPNILSASGVKQDNNFNGIAGEADDAATVTISILRLPFYRAFVAGAEASFHLVDGVDGARVFKPGDDHFAQGLGFTLYGRQYSLSEMSFPSSGVIDFASPSTSSIEVYDGTNQPMQLLYAHRDVTGDGIDDLILDWRALDGSIEFQAALELGTGTRNGALFFNYPDLDDPVHPAQSSGRTESIRVENNGVPALRNFTFYEAGFGDFALHSGMGLLVRDDYTGLSQYRFGSSVHVFGTGANDSMTLSYAAGSYNVLRNGQNSSIDASGIDSIYLHGAQGDDHLTVQSVRSGDKIGLDGNDGKDTLTMSAAGPIAEFGGLGDDSLLGGMSSDVLDGGPGSDVMRGYAGNDLYAFGAKTVSGEVDIVSELSGKGTDALDFSTLPGTQKAFINLGSDAEVATNGNRLVKTAAAGQAANFENASGGAGADRIVGNAASNVLKGYAGNDTLLGGPGSDVLDGGAGSDSLTGGRGDDTFLMLPPVAGQPLEQDTIVEAAGEGNDTLDFSHLPVGNDLTLNLNGLSDGMFGTLFGRRLLGEGTNLERVLGGAGNDKITGNNLDNVIYGNGGDDVLAGGGGNDRLYGGVGLDSLSGDAGNDWLYGGAGDDRYVFAAAVGNEVDTVFEPAGGGIDELDFSAVGQTMPVTVNLGQNLLATQSGRKVWEGAGTSFLDWENATGGAGDDTLTGNTKDNRLVGGPGNDSLQGGGGTDQLVQ